MSKSKRAVAAANTEVVLTIAAFDTYDRVRLASFGCSFDRNPAAGKAFTVESPSGTVRKSFYITAGGAAPINESYEGEQGAAVILRLAADTGGAIGEVHAEMQ